MMPELPHAASRRVPEPPIEIQMLIGGAWRSAETTYAVMDPYSGETVAQAPQSTLRDLDDALAAAVAAKAVAAAMPGYERAALLRRAGGGLAQRGAEDAGIRSTAPCTDIK